ncbi:hypothetical protein WH95_17065 [Kiloniella litopenaei]|uniref:Uncharacterized protein n=1 Tax=Kiloniella litopenaei TaxID=1549748 RepID=A0A0M2R6Q2_9PROT|nr:hypothetical protein WH95_17065 [Kiloniella litopenaei]
MHCIFNSDLNILTFKRFFEIKALGFQRFYFLENQPDRVAVEYKLEIVTNHYFSCDWLLREFSYYSLLNEK